MTSSVEYIILTPTLSGISQFYGSSNNTYVKLLQSLSTVPTNAQILLV